MPIVALVLLLCLVAALARNRQLRRRILLLEAESVRALEDDGLMAQIETAAAAGSDLAARLLTGYGRVRLQIAEGKTNQAGFASKPPVSAEVLGQTRGFWGNSAERRAEP